MIFEIADRKISKKYIDLKNLSIRKKMLVQDVYVCPRIRCGKNQIQKVSIQDVFEYVQKHPFACEVFENRCIPYFDFDKVCEREPSKKEIYYILMELINNIHGVFEEYGKVQTYVSQNHRPYNGKYKISFHIVVRGCGYFSCGHENFKFNMKHGLTMFDRNVYKKEGKTQKMRLPLTMKDIGQEPSVIIDPFGRVIEDFEKDFYNLHLASFIGWEHKCLDLKKEEEEVEEGRREKRVEKKNEELDLKEKKRKAKKLLPFLAQERVEEYDLWLKVVFALGECGVSLRTIYKWCQKTTKDNLVDEEKLRSILSSECAGEKVGLGSLVVWAREDNKGDQEKLKQIEKILRPKYSLRDFLKERRLAMLFKRRFPYVWGGDFYLYIDREKLWRKYKKQSFLSEVAILLEKEVVEYSWSIKQKVKKKELEEKEGGKVLKQLNYCRSRLDESSFLRGIVVFLEDEFNVPRFASEKCSTEIIQKINSLENHIPIKGGKVLNVLNREVRNRKVDDLFSFELPFELKKDYDREFCDEYFSALCNGHDELKRYLLSFCRHAFLGSCSKKAIVFLIGDGNNGKSLFCHLMKKLLGPFYYEPNLSILEGRNNRNLDVARKDLRGKRLCIFSEIDQGTKFSQKSLKDLSSGDTISTRGLFDKSMSNFVFKGLLFIQSNTMPTIDFDRALMNRFVLIPFLNTFEYNVTFKYEIEKRLNDFFCYIMEVAELNVEKPEMCRVHESNAIQDADPIQEFFNEYIEKGSANDMIQTNEVRKMYETFCIERRIDIKMRTFEKKMKVILGSKIKRVQKNGVRKQFFVGVKWKEGVCIDQKDEMIRLI